MDAIDNREILRRAWQTFGSRDPDSILACFTPDARWTAPAGNGTAVALGVASDMIGREAIARFLAVDFHRLFVSDVSVKFREFLGDGDRVVVEETMSATLRDGRRYVNDYCFVFELRDGLIHRVREYMDTARGMRMIGVAMGPDEPFDEGHGGQ